MPDFSKIFVSPPDSSLLYAGHYDPMLAGLSVAVAIFASYASLLVSQHVANASVPSTRRMWLAVGGLCMGLGIWAMHFVGMLALTLPCRSGYDTSFTLLSMIPGILACTLALAIISRSTLSRLQFVWGSLLLSSGIAAMRFKVICSGARSLRRSST